MYNPLRYRGYVYDEETGLYYLRSRYYNPEWGRFINADVLLGKRGALLSHNLFAYCANNPVNYTDANGYDMFCAFIKSGFDGALSTVGSIANAANMSIWEISDYAYGYSNRRGDLNEEAFE